MKINMRFLFLLFILSFLKIDGSIGNSFDLNQLLKSRNMSSFSKFIGSTKITSNYNNKNESEKNKSKTNLKLIEELQDQINLLKNKIESEDKRLNYNRKQAKIKNCMLNKKLCHFKLSTNVFL
jgi:hypothetical protein